MSHIIPIVVLALFTITERGEEVALPKLPEPASWAVMPWSPAARLENVRVAWPLATLALPREVVPSRKVTVPVAAEGVTDAVKVTLWPYTGEGMLHAKARLGATAFTVMLRPTVVLPPVLVAVTV